MSLKLPKSCTSLPINLIGLVGFLLTFYLLALLQTDWSTITKIIVILLATAIPIIVLEYIYKRPPILLIKPKKTNFKRIFIKLIGLYSVFAIIAFAYWLLPEYGNFYKTLWHFLDIITPWIFITAIPYFWFIDKRMQQPQDGYYALGLFVLGKYTGDRNIIKQLFLGWLVKFFFFPLMLVYFGNNVNLLLGDKYSFSLILQNFNSVYNYLWVIIFTIDLGFVTMGYLLTMRLFDSHIRSTEPTFKGWVIAIVCYQPFWSGIEALYFTYNIDNFSWGNWLEGSPILYTIWGIIILLLIGIYAFSSVMFGIRFSNLTHRGIITNGPYRYTKHPAYLSKNLSWWFIAIPFISQSGNIEEIIKGCCMLLMLNAIYYWRAKTEEQHLNLDPVYKNYTQWIHQHGMFAKIKNSLSFKT